jgi:hypothetical protein
MLGFHQPVSEKLFNARLGVAGLESKKTNECINYKGGTCPCRRRERHGKGCEICGNERPAGAQEGAGRPIHHRVGDVPRQALQAANIERARFAVLGVVINALDAAGAAAGANGLNIALDANLVTDIRSIASAVKGAVPVTAKLIHAARSVRLISPFKHVRLVTYAAKR